MLWIMKIFCCGIGGIGVSAYAAHMAARGHTVIGTDRSESLVTEGLQSLGIQLCKPGDALPENVDVLVYSEAVPSDALERKEAKQKNIRQLSYFQALGELTDHSPLIAICGTHGKSSTTAMAAKMLLDANKDPSVVLGTLAFDLGNKNWRKGEGEWWVAEACEYRRSFLHLSPKIILLTNADGDHFDAFISLEDYVQAFKEFVGKLPNDGVLIFHGNDPVSRDIAKATTAKCIDADSYKSPELFVPGKHMRENAALVLALAKELNILANLAEKSVAQYHGSWRRMEYKCQLKEGIDLFDDYAHHPVEIRATLQAFRERFPDRRIVCAYQPHTHERTFTLWKEFTSAFQNADLVLFFDVYDARPHCEGHGAVDMQKFTIEVAQGSKIQTVYAGKLLQALPAFQQYCNKGDILITMGAGDITNVAQLVSQAQEMH